MIIKCVCRSLSTRRPPAHPVYVRIHPINREIQALWSQNSIYILHMLEREKTMHCHAIVLVTTSGTQHTHTSNPRIHWKRENNKERWKKKKKNLLEEKERKKGKKEKVKNITKIAIIPGAHYLYDSYSYIYLYVSYILLTSLYEFTIMYTVCNKDDSSPGFSVGKQLKKEVALIIAYLAKKLLS